MQPQPDYQSSDFGPLEASTSDFPDAGPEVEEIRQNDETAAQRQSAGDSEEADVNANTHELLPVRPPAQSVRRVMFAAASILVGIVAGMAWLGPAGISDADRTHANWEKLTELQTHNESLPARGDSIDLLHTNDHSTDWSSAIVLTDADRDTRTTRAVISALRSGASDEAEKIIAGAQDIEQSADTELVPSIDTGMKLELLTGDSQFFHLYLFDSCAVDGDIVEVLIDQRPFATVPITHRGATLSIPVGRGTTVSLRGVRDGGGGITVACRTSQGDYFTQAMQTGEIQTVSVVQ